MSIIERVCAVQQALPGGLPCPTHVEGIMSVQVEMECVRGDSEAS